MGMNEQAAARAFYGAAYDELAAGIAATVQYVEDWQEKEKRLRGREALLYQTARIKSPESMREKLVRLGEPVTAEAALHHLTDAAGVRAVCMFVDDVYRLAEDFLRRPQVELLCRKDYIAHPKANGYRSYHVIARVAADGAPQGVVVELQIRTVSMDSWAALEHTMRYKQDVGEQAFLEAELKRCADEIASTELTMETIREMLDAQRRAKGCAY